jgi:hypothetical protein
MAESSACNDGNVQTTSSQLRITFLYSPLPEERDPETSASFELAHRSSRLFAETAARRDECDDSVQFTTSVEPLIETSFVDFNNDEEIANNKSSAISAGNLVSRFYVLFVSCAADGSVHRVVRKISKQFAAKDTSSLSCNATTYYNYALVLLGHARCDNSARQMSDTIFAAGRRLDKALQQPLSGLANRLETQVELVGPEEELDPWMQDLVARVVEKSAASV